MHDPGQSPPPFPTLPPDAPPALPLPGMGVLTLVGMAGAGKSTLGALLARRLGIAHLDTDRLLEAFYGLDLETLYQALGRDAFLQAEQCIVAGLWISQCVVSTGGSVIHSPQAMEHLAARGPIIWLRIEAGLVESRLAACGTRGLAIAPGQTLADLVAQRDPLYAAAATLTLDAALPVEVLADQLFRWLEASQP